MNTDVVTPQNFYKTEVEPIVNLLDGPISALSFREEYDNGLKAQAIESGSISAGAFSECEIFDDSPESKSLAAARRTAKTGQEILKVLSSDAEGVDTILNLQNTEQQVYRTVIVEAARVIKNKKTAGTLTGRERAIYTRALMEAQERLFSPPDKETSSLVVGLFNQELMTTQSNMSPAQSEYIKEYFTSYPWLQENAEQEKSEILPQDKLEALHTYLREQYSAIFQGIKDEFKEISNSTLAQMTNEFMRRIGLPIAQDASDQSGWLCIDNKNIVGFQVVPAKLRVMCGRRSLEITWQRFEQLMCHEVSGHVIRAENGRLSGYGALQNGLPGAADVEEGFGLTLERLWEGSADEKLGRDHYRYLTVSYAQGILDGKMHSETETLQFISGFMTIAEMLKKGPNANTEQVLRKQRQLAYDHIKRAFRGMPEGVILWSDTAYLKGRLDIMQFIAHDDRAPKELVDYLQQGKFDPNNRDHCRILSLIQPETDKNSTPKHLSVE